MSASSILGTSALSGQNSNSANSPSSSSAPADFAAEMDKITQTNAPMLKKREMAEKEQALAVKRIREVGLEQYIREQQEVKRLMKLLVMIKKEATGKVKEMVDNTIKHFEENPPAKVEEIYQYMASIAGSLPKGQIRDMLEELIHRIQDIMKEKALGATDEDVKRALMGLR